MTQVTDVGVGAVRARELQVVVGVSVAHFVSHYFILLLPPLFAFIRADYGVSYTELGIALAAFNLTSTIFQTPAGFLVDRTSPRFTLIGGLLLGAIAFTVAALVNSFWVMVAMFAIAGIGNTVYHPANYAILSRQISPRRVSQAYSLHSFSGMLGAAAAPATLLIVERMLGWRGAFLCAALFGVVSVVILLFQDDEAAAGPASAKPKADGAKEGWSLLLSAPILLNLLFFTLLSFVTLALQNYSVVALAALHGTPVATANAALSGHLFLMALGVLMGGVIAGRTSRHSLVAILALLGLALSMVVIGLFDLGDLLVTALLALGGMLIGLMMPSRDMMVRAITPPGSFGRVFGFLSTGMHAGGIVGPPVFGAMMDHGNPAAIFFASAAFLVLAVGTLMVKTASPRP
jgi:MFS family permease